MRNSRLRGMGARALRREGDLVLNGFGESLPQLVGVRAVEHLRGGRIFGYVANQQSAVGRCHRVPSRVPRRACRQQVQVDSGKGQNRTLTPLWPPVFTGEQDVARSSGSTVRPACCRCLAASPRWAVFQEMTMAVRRLSPAMRQCPPRWGGRGFRPGVRSGARS